MPLKDKEAKAFYMYIYMKGYRMRKKEKTRIRELQKEKREIARLSQIDIRPVSTDNLVGLEEWLGEEQELE